MVEVPSVIRKGYGPLESNPPAGSGTVRLVTSGNQSITSTEKLNIKYSHVNFSFPSTKTLPLDSVKPAFLITQDDCVNGFKFRLHTSFQSKPSSAVTAIDSALARWSRVLNLKFFLDRDANNDLIYSSVLTDPVNNIGVISYRPTSAFNANTLMSTLAKPDFGNNYTKDMYRIRNDIEIKDTTHWDYSIINNVPNNKADFLAAITHEVGHAIGLDHDIEFVGANITPYNLMHPTTEVGTTSANRPNINQKSSRAIEGANYQVALSKTKLWNFSLLTLYQGDLDYDYMIQDHPFDAGNEPYWDPDPMWTSQAIWVRRADDFDIIHENPTFDISDPNDIDYVYVKVKNRGCKTITGGKLHVYWAKASTGLQFPTHWVDYEEPGVGGVDFPAGDEITNTPIQPVIDIDPLDPGEESRYTAQWKVPNPNNFVDKDHHYCLLAVVESNVDSHNSNSQYLSEFVPYNNEVAWKNLSIEEGRDTLGFTKPTSVWLRPILPKTPLNKKVTIRVTSSKEDITYGGDVILHLKDDLYNKWINRTGKDAPTILGGQKIKINANNTDLVFDDVAQFDRYTIDVNYYADPLVVQPDQFFVDLSQIENSSVVGGERFDIRANSIRPPSSPLIASNIKVEEKTTFKISPNPLAAQNDLFVDVESTTGTKFNLKIVTTDGRILSQSLVKNGRNSIQFTDMKTGTYIAILMDGTKIISSQRFIVL